LATRALVVLLGIPSRAATTGSIARRLDLPPYSDERARLRPTLGGLRRRGLVRNTAHPVHGVWSLTRAGLAEAARAAK